MPLFRYRPNFSKPRKRNYLNLYNKFTLQENIPCIIYVVRGYSPEVSKGLEDLERAVTLVITNNYVEAEAILKDK